MIANSGSLVSGCGTATTPYRRCFFLIQQWRYQFLWSHCARPIRHRPQATGLYRFLRIPHFHSAYVATSSALRKRHLFKYLMPDTHVSNRSHLIGVLVQTSSFRRPLFALSQPRDFISPASTSSFSTIIRLHTTNESGNSASTCSRVYSPE